MLGMAVACLCLAVGNPAPSDADLAAYREARGKAGRDADAHVRLALWCEAHGLAADRVEHLAMALAADPAHVVARGLLGLVADDGKWRRPEEVTEHLRADARRSATLDEYATRRTSAKPTAESQWDLAVWCEQSGLADEAEAHFAAVTRLDPSREAAWKRLGYKKVDGRWRTDAEVAAVRADKAAQERADRRWKPVLEKARHDLKLPARRVAAEATLAAVTDPRAVPSAIRVFGSGRGEDATRLVQVLGQIDSPAASRALATLAVFADDDRVRGAATQTLGRRDPREWAGLLIGAMRDPIKFHVKGIQGPGTVGVLTIEGPDRDLRRLYRPPVAPGPQAGDQFAGYDDQGLPVVDRPTGRVVTYDVSARTLLPGWDGLRESRSVSDAPPVNPKITASVRAVTGSSALTGLLLKSFGSDVPRGGPAALDAYSAYGSEEQKLAASAISSSYTPDPTLIFTRQEVARIPIGRMEFEAQRGAVAAQAQMDQDVAALEAHNAPIQAFNTRAADVLKSATGTDLGEARGPWQSWLIEQIGFRGDLAASPGSRPTVDQDVPLNFRAPEIPIATLAPIVSMQRLSCFAAGTPVQTLTGPRPIESLAEGDRVLAQDVSTGRLGYEPVLFVHRNPPSATFRVDLDGDSVVASAFHRFWLAGRGWTMARDLKPGDPVRTVRGVVRVTAVEPEKVQPVFNLDVASARTFFVGQSAALVHDNSVPDLRAAPFDAPAELAKAGPSPTPE